MTTTTTTANGKAKAPKKGSTAAPMQQAEDKTTGATNKMPAFAKVEGRFVDAAIAHYGISHYVGGSMLLSDKTELLATAVFKVTPPSELGDCDVCGGTSDVRKSACPYCGTNEGGERIELEPPAPLAEGAIVTGNPGSQVAPAAPETLPAPPESNTHLTEVVVSAPDPVRHGKKGANGKGKKNSPPPVPEEDAIMMNGVPTGLAGSAAVTHGKRGSALMPTANLDKAVNDIKRAHSAGLMSAYAVGVLLKQVFDSHTWKERLTADGKVAYKTFQDFTKVELGFTKKYAFKLVKVAGAYTEEQVRVIGPAKLHLALEAHDTDRQAILDKAAAGVSKSDLEKEVRAKNKARKAKASGKAPPARKDGKLTLVVDTASASAALFAKPAKRGEEPTKPAKRIGDAPVAVIHLGNDTALHLEVMATTSGAWKVKYSFKRVESEDAE